MGVLGCIGADGDDDTDDDTDANGADNAGVDIGGRSLHLRRPLELVEPDATIGSGFAASSEHLTYIHGHGETNASHWHFAPIEVRRGRDRTVRTRYLDATSEEVPVGPDEEYRSTVELVDPSPEGFLAVATDADLVTLTGESIGEGALRFSLWRDDNVVWQAPLLDVTVLDSDDA